MSKADKTMPVGLLLMYSEHKGFTANGGMKCWLNSLQDFILISSANYQYRPFYAGIEMKWILVYTVHIDAIIHGIF